MTNELESLKLKQGGSAAEHNYHSWCQPGYQ